VSLGSYCQLSLFGVTSIGGAEVCAPLLIIIDQLFVVCCRVTTWRQSWFSSLFLCQASKCRISRDRYLLSIIVSLLHAHTHTHTHTQPFNDPLSWITYVGQYQKKQSPIHTHPDHQTSFVNFLYLLQCVASLSSFFKLHAWKFFSSTSLQVLFGLPLGLQPCISYTIHFFTQSLSSFCNACPYHHIAAVLLQYQCYVIIPNLSLSALHLEICLIMSLVDISSDIKLIWKLLVTLHNLIKSSDLSVDIFMGTDFQFLIPKSKSSRIASVPSHLIASPIPVHTVALSKLYHLSYSLLSHFDIVPVYYMMFSKFFFLSSRLTYWIHTSVVVWITWIYFLFASSFVFAFYW